VNTLNYWLGKLQRLQLFGHGVKAVQVENVNGFRHNIVDVRTSADGSTVIIKIDTGK